MAKKQKITLAGGPGYGGRLEIGERTVDDPFEPGRRIMATVNVREGAIAHLASRGRINVSQEVAGERFRKLWEKAAIGRSSAVDPGHEAVDGGGITDPISDDLVKAARELAQAMQAVGMIGSRILIAIVEHGSIERAALEWSKGGGIVSGKRAQGYVTGTMVDALNELVRHWRLEANGSAKNIEQFYIRNGEKVIVHDDIRASGPITECGPSHEIMIGRFGDPVRLEKRPVDRGPLTPHTSATASKFRRRK